MFATGRQVPPFASELTWQRNNLMLCFRHRGHFNISDFPLATIPVK